MGRRRYVFDEARTQRFIAQGRGTGEGADYRSWLQIQDLPSLGRSHRTFGIKTHRIHHLLSDGEWKCFLKLEEDPRVLDIREGFPMDRMRTSQAARALGFKHPTTSDGTPYVMTIDFLVTQRTDNGPLLRPCTFKYVFSELSEREEELIQIAEEFWRREGYVLERLDRTFIDEALVKHYDIVRSFFDISHLDFCARTDVRAIAESVRNCVVTMPDARLPEVSELLASLHGTTPMNVLCIVRHLLARRALKTDFHSPVLLERRTMSEFVVTPPPKGDMPW